MLPSMAPLQVTQHYLHTPADVVGCWTPHDNIGTFSVPKTLYVVTSLWYADAMEAYITTKQGAELGAQVKLWEAFEAKGGLGYERKTETTFKLKPSGPFAAQYWKVTKRSKIKRWGDDRPFKSGPMTMGAKEASRDDVFNQRAEPPEEWFAGVFDPSAQWDE